MWFARFVFGLIVISLAARFVPAEEKPAESLFSHDNLLAWCIVPFDAKKRTPQARSAMVENLGIRHCAYDWRAEHLPTFEAELKALAEHHIELSAVWFPTTLNADARFILDTLKRHQIKTQLWVSAAGMPLKNDKDPQRTIQAGVDAIRPIAAEAEKIGCTVALYNHGGWLGEPENQLRVIGELKPAKVGMIYNLHHGHEHVERFASILEKIKPHLMCLTLNGMTKDGERLGRKILPIGEGELDLQILKTIRDSGYRGRI